MQSYSQNFNCPVAYADFNGDSLKDWVFGTCNYDANSYEKFPLRLFLADASGGYSDSNTFPTEARLITPTRGATGDFNHDGVLDLIVFDGGNMSRGQAPTGGYYGEAPVYLRSTSSSTWVVDHSLSDEYIRVGSSDRCHAKFLASGDINNDGYPDVWVESGGGYSGAGYFSPQPHFLVNQGDGKFKIDFTRTDNGYLFGRDPAINSEYDPSQWAWRHAAAELKDLDGDGFLDLILGQLKRVRNHQNELDNFVVFNDGTGKFPKTGLMRLPRVQFKDGFSSVLAMSIGDLNGDLLPDLVLAHTRSQDDQNPNELLWTGRFIQILINGGARNILDETASWYNNPSIATDSKKGDGNWNSNLVRDLYLEDVNADQRPDIITLTNVWDSFTPSARTPFVYVNSGSSFTEYNPNYFSDVFPNSNPMWLPGALNANGLLNYLTVTLSGSNVSTLVPVVH